VRVPDQDKPGMTVEGAAKVLGVDQSTLSKIELADRNVTRPMLLALLSVYDADPHQKDELLALHATAKEKGWYQAYGVQPGAYVDWETEAAEVQDFEPLLIPGILQTGPYAEAVIAAAQPDLTDHERARWAATRAARAELLDDLGETQLWYIIGEAAFQTEVGGSEVMRDQAARVLAVATTVPGVTVQMLPHKAGAHMAMTGAFSVLTFVDLPPLGAVEHERTRELNTLQTAFGRLSAQALSPKESRKWLERL
jgi:transcriptional regulator with XRE-family HTH domain